MNYPPGVFPANNAPSRFKRAVRKTPAEKAAIKAALLKQLGATGYAIHCLMVRAKINSAWHLEDEQLFSIQVADRLRVLTNQYDDTQGEIGLRAVWFHVPNEGNRSMVTQMIMRAMGMLAGAPDFVFVWEGGSGLIELKAGSNDLTEDQEHFRVWSHARGVNWAMHRAGRDHSVEKVMDTLIRWGAIIGIPEHGALEILG